MPRIIDADKIQWHYLPLSALGDLYVTQSEVLKMPEVDVQEVRHGRWVKTTTKKPQNGETVIGFKRWEDGEIEYAMLNFSTGKYGDSWEEDIGDYGAWYYEPDYWMQLPEPPKEDEDENSDM